MLITSTIASWKEFADLRGNLAPDGNDSAGNPYTPTQQEQALQRAIDYIINFYYNRFLPRYKSDTIEGLQAHVRQALQDATNIAASDELRTPNRYSVKINPLEDREIIQVDDIKYRPTTHTSSEDTLMNSHALDNNINALLSQFIGGNFNLGVFTPKVY